jgi:hypothetical protein
VRRGGGDYGAAHGLLYVARTGALTRRTRICHKEVQSVEPDSANDARRDYVEQEVQTTVPMAIRPPESERAAMPERGAQIICGRDR